MGSAEYKRQWYLKNRERILKKASERYVKKGRRTVPKEIQKQRRIEYAKQYRQNNSEKLSLYQKEVRKTDRFKKLKCAREAKRRALKLNATPNWSDLNKIKEIYMNCPQGHHVDHIIPLQGKNVSGLHIPINLQYLPATENLSKSNKWEV